MARTTLRIARYDIESGPRLAIISVSEPANVAGAQNYRTLDCDVSASPFSDLSMANQPQGALVRSVGEALFQRLTRHPGVSDALRRIDNAPPAEQSPIYLQMTTEIAEALPFEALYLPTKNFLSLDERTPIVRVAVSGGTNAESRVFFTYPLRATIVISATGVGPQEDAEWDAIYQAWKDSGLDFALQVFVGRKSLYDDISALGDPRISVERIMSPSSGDFVKSVGEFAPGFLHFFCHGTTDGGGYLMIGTTASHLAAHEPPLCLSHDHLRRIGSPFFIVLNACEGSAPIHDMYSLAMSVARAGQRAVIGMRESIPASDANRFSEALYPALLAEMKRLHAAGSGVPDWAVLLRAGRERLTAQPGALAPQAAVAASKSWTLPVLYVGTADMELVEAQASGMSPQQQSEKIGELRKYLEIRQALPASMPDELRLGIDKRIRELMGEIAKKVLSTS